MRKVDAHTDARTAAAIQPCTADRTGKSHSAFARRLRRQSRGASGDRDSTVSHRAAHHNTAALLHGTSCGQIERRICAVPAEALTPVSRFPFRAQTGHEARAIPVGRPCQDQGIGNENFGPDLAPHLFPTSEPCTRGQSWTQSRCLSSSFDRKTRAREPDGSSYRVSALAS